MKTRTKTIELQPILELHSVLIKPVEEGESVCENEDKDDAENEEKTNRV